MIDYTLSESPFFMANRRYCEKVTQNLQARNIGFTGLCDSYGYEINARFSLNNHQYQLKCYKYQVTRDGVIIPNNAAEYLGIEIIGSGFNEDAFIKYARNWFRRFLMPAKLRTQIQYPFYLKVHPKLNVLQMQEWLTYFTHYKMIRFYLDDKQLEIKIFSAFTDPVKIIEDFEEKFISVL